MNIILDNIIFSLQVAGGISVVWYEHLRRLLVDADFRVKIVEYENQNMFRQKIEIPNELFINDFAARLPLVIRRCLSPKISEESGIFHSSYYRVFDRPGIKNLTTVHDLVDHYYRDRLRKRFHNYQKANAINASDRILCVSVNTKKDLMKFFPHVKESRIRVVYNGVDDAYRMIPAKSESEIRRIAPFASGEYVLFVGDRRRPYKNFRFAVEACKMVHAPLLVAGGGAISEYEKDFLARELGINGYFALHNLSNESMNVLYNHALCLVYPSAYEGFGLPIIEAQKAGCPVICGNSSSIPEIAGDGAILLNQVDENGVASSIRELRGSFALRDQIIQNGIVNAKRFSWDRCYQETTKVYKELFEERA